MRKWEKMQTFVGKVKKYGRPSSNSEQKMADNENEDDLKQISYYSH